VAVHEKDAVAAVHRSFDHGPLRRPGVMVTLPGEAQGE